MLELGEAEGLWHFTTKTPLHSIQSILYVDMKKPNSVFVKVSSHPPTYALKEFVSKTAVSSISTTGEVAEQSPPPDAEGEAQPEQEGAEGEEQEPEPEAEEAEQGEEQPVVLPSTVESTPLPPEQQQPPPPPPPPPQHQPAPPLPLSLLSPQLPPPQPPPPPQPQHSVQHQYTTPPRPSTPHQQQLAPIPFHSMLSPLPPQSHPQLLSSPRHLHPQQYLQHHSPPLQQHQYQHQEIDPQHLHLMDEHHFQRLMQHQLQQQQQQQFLHQQQRYLMPHTSEALSSPATARAPYPTGESVPQSMMTYVSPPSARAFLSGQAQRSASYTGGAYIHPQQQLSGQPPSSSAHQNLPGYLPQYKK